MVEAAHMQQSGQEKGTFFSRTNFMHTVYVERLNRPWKPLMETGKREAVKASARNPVDIVPERNELLFLHSGMVRLYDASARSNGRIMLLMGPQCLLHFAFFEQGEAAFPCRISAEKPVCLYRLRCDDMPQAEFVRRHPELFVNAVHSLARLNLLFLYRAHAFSFSSAGARLCRLLLSFEAQSPPPLTQKDMAALIGVTQETLCRLLFSLRERGIVGKRENGRIPLLDIDRLCALSRMETTLLPKEKICPPLLPPRNAVWNS